MVYVPSRIRSFPYVVTSIGGILLATFAPPGGAAFVLAASALSLARAGAFERLHPDGSALLSNGVLVLSAVVLAGAAASALSATTPVIAGVGIIGTIVLGYGIIRATRREFPDEILDDARAGAL